MGKFGVKGSVHRVEVRLLSDVYYFALKHPFDKSRIVSCIPESLTVSSILPCLTLYALLSTEIGERSPSLNTDTYNRDCGLSQVFIITATMTVSALRLVSLSFFYCTAFKKLSTDWL